MANQVGNDNEVKGKEVAMQFEDEGGKTVGIGPVTVRFLDRFTGHVSLFRRRMT